MPVIMTPVIINHTKECIVQDGKKYCEQSDMSKQEAGYLCLGTIVLVFYTLAPFNLEKRYGDNIFPNAYIL